jgi:predicted GNAT family acetyltransferase
MDGTSISISDEPAADRYVARLGSALVGFVEYRRIGGRIVFIHTKVPPEFEGRGIASALARHILDKAREDGTRVTIKCPYLLAFVERHPEYAPAADERPERPPGPR